MSLVTEIPSLNVGRLKYDMRLPKDPRYYDYWKGRNHTLIPPEVFSGGNPVSLEIGAGTGWYLLKMAKLKPLSHFIAIERCRMRGNRLVHRAERAALPNVWAYRGNAIPALIHGVPSESVDRLYILYPCPFPKSSQRKNRWYLHPLMPHLKRILKPGGLLIWASDQKFYIDEARYVCESHFEMNPLVHGEISPNPYNDLELFPGGRTKFEASFLGSGQPCYELIVKKS